MKKLSGVIPPMITPFLENGDLDVSGLKILVGYLKNEVDGLFITGSYGSGPMMTIEERKLVTELTVKEAGGKIPIIAMIGTTNNRESVELAVHAENVGVKAIAAVGPYYFSHKKDDLVCFYKELINSVNIPVYLYNNPGFQGYETVSYTHLTLPTNREV